MSNLTSAAASKAIWSVKGPVDLRKYSKIKPDVARQLCCDEELDLSGLKTISPELIEALKNHRGGLILDGLSTLPIESAKAFKEHFKASLHFGSLKYLDDEAAMELSQREAGDGNWKYWPKAIFPEINKFEDTPGHLALFTKLIKHASSYDFKAKEITPTQAEIIVKENDDIGYGSIESLNPEVAKILANSKKKICLSGIKSMDEDTANALANHQEMLTLSGLERVSDPLALALSKHKGKVSLGGLKEMPDSEGFIELAKKLALENKESLTNYSEKLGAKVAEIFTQCDKIRLHSLSEVANTPEHAKLIEKVCSISPEESISFYSLKVIPDPILKIFAQCPGKVDLGGPTEWEQGPGHIAWAQRLVNSKPSAGSYSVYNSGEFFPDKIAEIFANSTVELNNLKKFDSSPGNIALANRFSTSPKYLSITKISPEVSEILSKNPNGNYNFSDLEEIDTKSFEILFSKKDSIYLSKLKKINAEIAKMTEGEKSLGFDSLCEINLDIAKSFGQGSGTLYLRGLKEIDDQCLAEIVKRNGGDLYLGGLTTLTESQSKLLSQAKSNLYLSEVSDLSDQSLSNLLELDTSKVISLPKLTKISEENAMKFSKRAANIDINGVESLEDKEGYIALATKLTQNWNVDLTAIKKLGPKVATELSKKSTLKLRGLSEIDDETAKALAKVSDTLELPNLNKTSREVAESLSQFSGSLTVGNTDLIDDETFEILVKNKKKLSFRATELSPRKAQAIAKIESLYIMDLETVTEEAAKCFKGYKGDIYMQDLCSLTPEAAKELRKLRSKLNTSRSGQWALATGA